MTSLTLLADLFLIAGTVFYIWMLVSQLNTPGLKPVQKWLRLSWRRPLTSCPYCFAFWLAFVITLSAQWATLHWVYTPLTILASAGLAGYIGSLTPGMDAEEDILDED